MAWREVTQPLPNGWYWWHAGRPDELPEDYKLVRVSHGEVMEIDEQWGARKHDDFSGLWKGPLDPHQTIVVKEPFIYHQPPCPGCMNALRCNLTDSVACEKSGYKNIKPTQQTKIATRPPFDLSGQQFYE